MGNATSKAAKSASKLSATNTARKYPPPSSNRTNAPAQRSTPGASRGPTVHPKTQISENRDQSSPPPHFLHTLETRTRTNNQAAINLDSSDPDLELEHNRRARMLGPVVANPTLSNSSTFNQAHGNFRPSNASQTIFPSAGGSYGRANPAVSLLAARERIAAEAEEEFGNIGRRGVADRKFLDVFTLRQVLQMRDNGVTHGEIEEKLGLKRGSVGVLGKKDVFGLTMVA